MSDDSPAKVEQLEAELARLRPRVKALFETEAALAQARLRFAHHERIFEALHQLAAELMVKSNAAQVAVALAHFVTKHLRYECAVVLQRDPNGDFYVLGSAGYEPSLALRIRDEHVLLSEEAHDVLLTQRRVVVDANAPTLCSELCESFALAELVAYALVGPAGALDGLLLAGNSAAGLGTFLSVRDPTSMSGLANLASLSTALLSSVASRAELEAQRADLERKVSDRTREIALALDGVTRLSRTDALTQLANRRAIVEHAAHALEMARRHRRSAAIILCDVDYFKSVNDRFGHQVGDAVLVAVAQALANGVRQVDKAARYGGEEFMILLTETTPEAVSQVAARCRELVRTISVANLAATGVTVPEDFTVTASFGTAHFPRDGADFETLVQAADRALYAAKESGRDAIVAHEDIKSTARRPRILVHGGESLARYEHALGIGYEVVLADSPQEAFRAFNEASMDVLVVDDQAGRGAELVAYARSHSPHMVQVALLSGTAHAELSIAVGADAFLLYDDLELEFRETVDACRALRKTVARGVPKTFPTRRTTLLDSLDTLLLGELSLHWQPIVDAKTRLPVAYEGLCRVAHPIFKHPALLFDVAAKTGRIHPLGRKLRKAAARAAEGLPSNTFLFLNAHPAELDDPELVADLLQFRAPERIVLEVTEAAHVIGTSIAEPLQNLRQTGARIAVDDLGAGYASLSTVALLHPEFIKIDLSLVRDIHLAPSKARLVQSVVEFARDLGIRVVAEGIEAKEEADCVTELGCDWLQGYYFGRPTEQPT